MVRLEKMILREIKALKQANTTTTWTQHIRCYNKLQERYAKEHAGMRYEPREAYTGFERQIYD